MCTESYYNYYTHHVSTYSQVTLHLPFYRVSLSGGFSWMPARDRVMTGERLISWEEAGLLLSVVVVSSLTVLCERWLRFLRS